jgi:hypothetical protein
MKNRDQTSNEDNSRLTYGEKDIRYTSNFGPEEPSISNN